MKIENLKTGYGEKIVLDGLSLQVSVGEIVCVLGASGSGKTTLLNVLAGLKDYEGSVEGLQQASYIFQEPRLIPNLTVRQNLAFVGCDPSRAEDLLQKTGLLPLADQRPNKLSGGERGRVAIVRAFAYSAPLLLMDEPFSGLDAPLKIKLVDLFFELWEREKRTVVFVTHNIEEATIAAHRILLLKGGKIAREFLPEGKPPRSYIYGEQLKTEILKTLAE